MYPVCPVVPPPPPPTPYVQTPSINCKTEFSAASGDLWIGTSLMEAASNIATCAVSYSAVALTVVFKILKPLIYLWIIILLNTIIKIK